MGSTPPVPSVDLERVRLARDGVDTRPHLAAPLTPGMGAKGHGAARAGMDGPEMGWQRFAQLMASTSNPIPAGDSAQSGRVP